MNDLTSLGRTLVLIGAGVMLVGGLLLLAGRAPWLGWLGQLPGDLIFRRGAVTVYVPIITSVILSVVLTVVVNLFLRR